MSFYLNIPIAMLNSIWIMSIIYILYVFIKYVIPFKASKAYLLAVFAQIGSSLFYIFSISNPTVTNFTFINFVILNNSIWFNAIPYIGILYTILIFAYLLSIVIEYLQLARLKKTANFEQNIYWNQSLNKYGLSNYQIGQSNKIKSPITFGWMDPVILLPLSLLNHLTINEVKYILLHEVAHILRNDFIVQLCIKLSHGVLLFNPFSYFFIIEINKQRELACDEWVINQFGGNPLEYTKSLYNLSLINTTVESQLALNAIGNQKELLQRIKHIHQIQESKRFPLKQMSLAFLLFIVTSIGVQWKASTTSNTLLAEKYQEGKNNLTIQKNKINFKNYKTKKSPIILIDKLTTTIPTPIPYKEEEYTAVVSNAMNWIKTREDQYQMVNHSNSRDSLEFEITEKLLLRSILNNYQLRKELLNEKLSTIESEKEAIDYLENSKEWQEMLQYENWAKTFLNRHPDLNRKDSLRRF